MGSSSALCPVRRQVGWQFLFLFSVILFCSRSLSDAKPHPCLSELRVCPRSVSVRALCPCSMPVRLSTLCVHAPWLSTLPACPTVHAPCLSALPACPLSALRVCPRSLSMLHACPRSVPVRAPLNPRRSPVRCEISLSSAVTRGKEPARPVPASAGATVTLEWPL